MEKLKEKYKKLIIKSNETFRSIPEIRNIELENFSEEELSEFLDNYKNALEFIAKNAQKMIEKLTEGSNIIKIIKIDKKWINL